MKANPGIEAGLQLFIFIGAISRVPYGSWLIMQELYHLNFNFYRKLKTHITIRQSTPQQPCGPATTGLRSSSRISG
jgi:hypothetical protein